MNARTREAELSMLLRQFGKSFAKWLTYLVGLVTTASAIAVPRILPMYASQRQLFFGLASLTSLTAFAVASSFAVICWYEKCLRLSNSGAVRPRALFLKLALFSLTTALVGIPIYLLIFDASVKIQTALLLCAGSAPNSELARDTLVSLAQTDFIFHKLQIANQFLIQWGTVPPGISEEVVASSADMPYGYLLMGLNILIVVGLQSGLFLLGMCNFFAVRAKKSQQQRSRVARSSGSPQASWPYVPSASQKDSPESSGTGVRALL